MATPISISGGSFSPPLESLLAETTQLTPGFRLDRYELLCPIATGGMASVWVARLQGKHGFEKLVAIKTILPHCSQDPRFQRMFLDEARIASGIDHVNVARILDLGEQGRHLYLVMEWVDGDSLSRLLRTVEQKGERVLPGIALRTVADASGGLHAAHELRDRMGTYLGVVHRDVSPQNILLNVEGVAKVIDFGIAKARHRLAGDTIDGGLKGKLLYMAPEQARGGDIDRRADVWSLGAVLYHLLAGSPPFKGPSEAATFGFLTSGLPPQPLPSSVPAAVVEVVRRALGPVDKRYSTAAELQSAIEDSMVEARLTTRVADVAAYVEKYLGERVSARRALVHEAIEVTAMREKAREHRAASPIAPPETPQSAGAVQGTMSALRRRWITRRAVPAAALIALGAGLMALGRVHLGAAAPRPSGDDHANLLHSDGPPATPIQRPDPSSQAPDGNGSAPRTPSPSSAVAAPVLREAKHAIPSRTTHATASECDPPYTIDSDGIRHYKRACFR